MAHEVAQHDQDQSQGHIRGQWGQLPIELQCVSLSAFPLGAYPYPGAVQVSVYGSEFYMGLYVLRPDRHTGGSWMCVCEWTDHCACVRSSVK